MAPQHLHKGRQEGTVNINRDFWEPLNTTSFNKFITGQASGHMAPPHWQREGRKGLQRFLGAIEHNTTALRRCVAANEPTCWALSTWSSFAVGEVTDILCLQYTFLFCYKQPREEGTRGLGTDWIYICSLIANQSTSEPIRTLHQLTNQNIPSVLVLKCVRQGELAPQ